MEIPCPSLFSFVSSVTRRGKISLSPFNRKRKFAEQFRHVQQPGLDRISLIKRLCNWRVIFGPRPLEIAQSAKSACFSHGTNTIFKTETLKTPGVEIEVATANPSVH